MGAAGGFVREVDVPEKPCEIQRSVQLDGLSTEFGFGSNVAKNEPSPL
jgi:hypothetical protein